MDVRPTARIADRLPLEILLDLHDLIPDLMLIRLQTLGRIDYNPFQLISSFHYPALSSSSFVDLVTGFSKTDGKYDRKITVIPPLLESLLAVDSKPQFCLD